MAKNAQRDDIPTIGKSPSDSQPEQDVGGGNDTFHSGPIDIEDVDKPSTTQELVDEHDEADYVYGFIDGAEEPDRDLDSVDPVLINALVGDELSIEFGIKSYQNTLSGHVVGKKQDTSPRAAYLEWDYVVEVCVDPDDPDIAPRLFRIGIGNEKLGRWFMFSYDYVPGLNLMDEHSEVGHGWIISASKEASGGLERSDSADAQERG